MSNAAHCMAWKISIKLLQLISIVALADFTAVDLLKINTKRKKAGKYGNKRVWKSRDYEKN